MVRVGLRANPRVGFRSKPNFNPKRNLNLNPDPNRDPDPNWSRKLRGHDQGGARERLFKDTAIQLRPYLDHTT